MARIPSGLELVAEFSLDDVLLLAHGILRPDVLPQKQGIEPQSTPTAPGEVAGRAIRLGEMLEA
jgi:hypothetical protein